MKNDYCNLSYDEIKSVPQRFKGFFLSPFQYNLRNGMVLVPDDTFKEMIALIAELAIKERDTAPQPQEQS